LGVPRELRACRWLWSIFRALRGISIKQLAAKKFKTTINVVFSKNKIALPGTVMIFLTYSFMRLYQYNEDDLPI